MNRIESTTGTIMPKLIRSACLTTYLVHPVFGALLVLSMRFMPNGVAGAVSMWRWLATWARPMSPFH
jgi:hypothetical protein